MKSHLTHVAILVNSIERVARFFAERNFHINSPESFESEGTREIYVGNNNKNSSTILLVEPMGEGPYNKALKKRGAGIHHIGLDVENLADYCVGLGQAAGWLLHTHSLRSIPKLRTAYLIRPSVPLMLEVHERICKERAPSLLTGIRLECDEKFSSMFASIGCGNAQITSASLGGVIFETLNGNFSLQDVLAYDRKSL